MSQSRFFDLTPYRKSKQKQKTKPKESFVELNEKLFMRNCSSKCPEVATLID